MKKIVFIAMMSLAVVALGITILALVVPNEIQQPGTQPEEIGNLESPGRCDNCHGGYDVNVEPSHNWQGSMMANAGRDPIFWATLAIAEQDFDGSGDLCIRCHSTAGWLAGRSTPTDGSGLAAGDSDGVECDFCHLMTNPDNSEHLGVMNPPFIANDEAVPATGYYGSGIASMWNGAEKLGPYIDADARHQFMQSAFHRSRDFCGTCHDVSNPAVGDLAANFGTQPTADPVVASGTLGSPVDGKAAFNNFPYKYGIVERTFSEYKSSRLSQMLVSEYTTLPLDLQGGALKAAYESAIVAGTGGNYEDGSPRYFGCQTCHVRPVTGVGCNKAGAPLRKDLPLHDMTGGNYWMPDAIIYLDNLGLLRLGGGMNAAQISALQDGKVRVLKQLKEAVTLQVSGNVLKIVNQTGHKLISGYPEGRRMWLNVKWYDSGDILLREDGAYGPVALAMDLDGDGANDQVDTILDLDDPNTKIYEAQPGISQEWASQLLGLNTPANMALGYDRITGAVTKTLGELGAEAPGSIYKTFHFVLNNTIVKDNRIPPYGMNYNEARVRNALPVPNDQFGNPGSGGEYNYWDELTLNPPVGAVYATIDMVYQPTSWEYIQFLYLANNRQNPFTADEGINLLNAWLNTGMAFPEVMASTTWGTAPTPPQPEVLNDSLTTWLVSKKGDYLQEQTIFVPGDSVGFWAHTVDENSVPVEGAQVFFEVRDEADNVMISLQAFSDANGDAKATWSVSRQQTAGNFTCNITDIIINGYVFNSAGSVTVAAFRVE